MIDSTQLTNRDLNLDDPASDRMILVDGARYPFLRPNELPPLDARRFMVLSRRLDALIGQEQLAEADETELEHLPRQMVGLIVRAPAEVLDRLTGAQQSRVVSAFLQREGA
jgi:hypothetical protein